MTYLFLTSGLSLLWAPQISNYIYWPKLVKDQLILAKQGVTLEVFQNTKSSRIKKPRFFFASRTIFLNGTSWTGTIINLQSSENLTCPWRENPGTAHNGSEDAPPITPNKKQWEDRRGMWFFLSISVSLEDWLAKRNGRKRPWGSGFILLDQSALWRLHVTETTLTWLLLADMRKPLVTRTGNSLALVEEVPMSTLKVLNKWLHLISTCSWWYGC